MLVLLIASIESDNLRPRAPSRFYKIGKPKSGQAEAYSESLLFRRARLFLQNFSSGSAVVQSLFRIFSRLTLLLSGLWPESRAAIRLYRHLAFYHRRAGWNCGSRPSAWACKDMLGLATGALARAVNLPYSPGGLPSPRALFAKALIKSSVADGCSWVLLSTPTIMWRKSSLFAFFTVRDLTTRINRTGGKVFTFP